MKEALNECLSHEEMVQAIKQLDLSELGVSDYHFISKKLKKTEPLRPFRVAYLGNFTIAPLNDYVEVYAANNGLSVSSHLGEYDQYHQEILDDSGDVKKFDPHMVMLALSLRKLTPEVVTRPVLTLCLSLMHRNGPLKAVEIAREPKGVGGP